MAAVLNLDTASWARVALYEDDSLEAWFADGSKISLTACATAFTREETKAMRDRSTGHSQHDAPSSVHQFTAYAARGCRERVRQLLSFRNYFAERPFLPPFLFRQDILVRTHVHVYVHMYILPSAVVCMDIHVHNVCKVRCPASVCVRVCVCVCVCVWGGGG